MEDILVHALQKQVHPLKLQHPQLEKLQPSDRHNHLLAIKQDADVSLPEAPPETQALPSCYKTLTLGPGACVAGIVVKMGVTIFGEGW